MTNESLRPLSLGEILDRTAQLYRRNFLLFAGVGSLPAGVMLLLVVPFGGAAAFFGLVSARIDNAPGFLAIGLIAALVLLLVPITVAATVLSQAAITAATIQRYMGRDTTIRAALKIVWPRFWTYFGVLLLQGIFAAIIPGIVAGIIIGVLAFLISLAKASVAVSVLLGFLMFVVGAAAFVYIVWRSLGYAMALPACVVEQKPAWNSLERAVALSKDGRGRIFLMFLLVWALATIVSILGYIPTTILMALAATIGHGAQSGAVVIAVAEFLNVIVNFALQAVITPVYMIALTLLYYDQRVRLEGYDIVLLIEQAGLAVAAPSTANQDVSLTAGEEKSNLLP